jgi:AcrR family transcriptional regulator
MNLPKGRPRDQHADAKILKAAMCLLEKHGFRAVTLEGIAEEAGVARTTVYRRWPNKAAIVMDAFLTHVAPRIAFPEHPVAVISSFDKGCARPRRGDKRPPGR